MASSFKKSPFLQINYISIDDNSYNCFQDYLFFYIIDGSVRVSEGNSTYLLAKNDVFLFNAGSSYFVSSGGSNIVLSIIIKKEFLHSAHGGIPSNYICNSADDHTRDYEPLRQYMLQIADARNEVAALADLRLTSLAYSLVFYLEKFHRQADSLSDFYANPQKQEKIDQILGYINQNYASPITLSDAAEFLSFSVPYLSVFFKKNMGINFNSYLNQVRLNHAVEQLENTDKSITEITYDNGFPNMNSFHRHFKERFHTTPGNYRARNTDKATAHPVTPEASVTFLSDEKIAPFLDKQNRQNPEIFYNIMLPSQKKIRISDMHDVSTVVPIWKSMIVLGGIEAFNYLHFENHLSDFQKKCQFTYGKLEHVAEINNPSFIYHFEACINSMVQNDMLPYLDLSVPVSDLNSDQHTLIIDNRSYLDFLESMVKHTSDTYGSDYVEKWCFEINPHVDLDSRTSESNENFILRFEMSYRLLKKLLPNAKVGGLCHDTLFSEDRILNVLKALKDRNIIPDFLSIGGFPYEAETFDNIPSKSSLTYTDDPFFFRNKCKNYKKRINQIFRKKIPLHFSYINADSGRHLYINDSAYQASFLFHNIVSLIDEVVVLGFSKLSDMTDLASESEYFLFGGCGLINRYGLLKPGAQLLETFALCRPNMVSKGEDYVIFKGPTERYMIGLCNFTYIQNSYRQNVFAELSPENAYIIYEKPQTKNVEIELNNLESGPYYLIQIQINTNYGSILNEWVRNGCWKTYAREELEYFSGINRPKKSYLIKEAIGGTIKLQLQLAPHEVVFFALLKRTQ